MTNIQIITELIFLENDLKRKKEFRESLLKDLNGRELDKNEKELVDKYIKGFVKGDNMSKTKIKEFNVNWLAIKNACRTTVSLNDSEKEPTSEWKRKLLICRHSPLRKGKITWRWDSIPYAISTHFVRHHIGCEKWISTSRADRTGVDRNTRSQMNNVSMEMEANVEALQNIAEKRLCMCADKTTREYMEDLKSTLYDYDSDIAWSLVPSCIRNGGCIECFGDCHFYENFAKELSPSELIDLKSRYDKYDSIYQKVKRKC